MTIDTPRALGAVPSPHDYRDYMLTGLLAKITGPFNVPRTYVDDLDVLGPVMDQNKEPACVSHSMALLMKRYWYHKTGKVVDFSPRFLDVLAKRYDGQPLDGGTIPRLVLKLMTQYGCATTKTVPNNTDLPLGAYRDDRILSEAAFIEAAQYKIPGFIRIPNDYYAVRQAVYLHGAVSTLLQIGDEWWVPSWDSKDIDPLRVPKHAVGGHQVTTHGWSDLNLNILRNSWSKDWNVKGDAHYDFERWKPYLYEHWVIADIPEDMKDFLTHLPSVSEFHYAFTTDLHKGDNNADVRYLQIALMITGFLEAIPPEQLGVYGPKTAAAVHKYQIAHKVTPQDGTLVGPKTRAALNKQFAL